MVELKDIIAYTKYKIMYISLFKLSDRFFGRNIPFINNPIEIEPDSDSDIEEDDININDINIISNQILLKIEFVHIVYSNKIKNITNKVKILLNLNKTLLISHIKNIISLKNNPIMFIKYKKNNEFTYKIINILDETDVISNKRLLFGKIIT